MEQSKKEKKFFKTFKKLIKEYSIVITTVTSMIVASFKLGMLYEEVKKNREISNLENQYSKELLRQKEEYMDKYYDLREKKNKNETNKSHEK